MNLKHHESAPAATFAVLLPAGPLWRALVAERRNGHLAVKAAREFAAESVDRLLDPWLDEANVGHIICLLPAGAAICRTCTLPNIDEDQLDQALALQAEAHFAGITPPHRQAAAPLHAAPGETSRTGILIGWPPASDFTAPATTRPVTYAPVVAAVAGLIDGDRPTNPVLWLDRSDGSVAMAVSHANGVALRATREDATDRLKWHAAIGRALAETALSVGHTGGFTESLVDALRSRLASADREDAMLIAPPDVIDAARQRVDGGGADQRWWAQYGVAVGAALATTDELAPLTTLRATQPVEAPSAVRTIMQTLAKPSTAVLAVTILIGLLAFGPLALNWLRLQVLQVRFGDLQTELAAINEMKHELSLYRELDGKAWPMTKILADIACNTPPGIELEYIRINQGETFAVSGNATPQPGQTATELVEQMMRNLGQTHLFGETTVKWDKPTAYGRYDFDLSASILRPHHRPAYDVERDFAAWTMQQRVDGVLPEGVEIDESALAAINVDPGPDTARSSTPPSNGGASAPPPSALAGAGGEGSPEIDVSRNGRRPAVPPRAGMNNPGGTVGGELESFAEGRGEGARGSDPSQDIPEPLSPTQIDAMTKDEARAALTLVSKARRYNKDDKELQDRLKNEFDLLLARLKKP